MVVSKVSHLSTFKNCTSGLFNDQHNIYPGDIRDGGVVSP